MKKLLVLLSVFSFAFVQNGGAQVFADFEVDTDGFADNGWGSGFTSVEQIADPTSLSDGVLALNCDSGQGDKGVIQVDNLDPQNAETIDVDVWLPADFPDAAQLSLWAQDNVHWTGWNASEYPGSGLAKEQWVSISFKMRDLAAANPDEFYPYDGAILGKFGLQVYFGGGSWSGRVLVDNFRRNILRENKSWVMSDFENEELGIAGFGKGWGDAYIDLYWFPDPTARSAGVMEFEVDFTDDIKAAFQKDGIDIQWTATDTGAIAFSFDVYLPEDFPPGGIIKIWAQDRANWTWVDYKYNINGAGGDPLPVEEWATITFDLLNAINNNPGFDATAGIKCGVELYDDTGDNWDGLVEFDNFTLIGVSPPEATLASPQVTTVTPDTLEGANGTTQYVNHIEWQDLEGSAGETYNIYASDHPITDATADGLTKIAVEIPRGVGFFSHEIYGAVDAENQLYYAVTTHGVDAGKIVETPVLDGVSNAGPVANGTTVAPVIPLVDAFNFTADGDLGEFQQFADAALTPERAGGAAAGDWTPASTDFNFSGWLVMDNENLYIGFDVVDDDPWWGTQAWQGDGFDVFAGLYDVSQQSVLHGDGSMYSDEFADYRFSFARNANEGEQFQKDGFDPWPVSNLEIGVAETDKGYAAEIKIPFKSVKPLMDDLFVPQKGMYIPLKIDLNDNDGPDDPYGDGRSMTLHVGGVDNDQNWRRPFTWGWALVGGATGVADKTSTLPISTHLFANYPNPFNPATTIHYELGHNSRVQLILFDVLGRRVRTLVDAHQKSGEHLAVWDATDEAGRAVAAGVYFVKMTAGDESFIQKIMLVK